MPQGVIFLLRPNPSLVLGGDLCAFPTRMTLGGSFLSLLFTAVGKTVGSEPGLGFPRGHSSRSSGLEVAVN